MQIKVRIFEVYESEGGGKRPGVGWVFVLTSVFGGMAYVAKYLELLALGAAFPHDTALWWAIAKALVVFGFLSVGWMGISISHYTHGTQFAGAGVLENVPKNRPPVPDLNKQMEPGGKFESATDSGVWVRTGKNEHTLFPVTVEQFGALVQHVEDNGGKVTFALYRDSRYWTRAENSRIRYWLIKEQLAEAGERSTVLLKPQTARMMKSAWAGLSRGY